MISTGLNNNHVVFKQW